jgi:hypothetical protein
MEDSVPKKPRMQKKKLDDLLDLAGSEGRNLMKPKLLLRSWEDQGRIK